MTATPRLADPALFLVGLAGESSFMAPGTIPYTYTAVCCPVSDPDFSRVDVGMSVLLPAAGARPGAIVFELIPCQRVRPSAGYLAAGDRLLHSLTRTRPVRVPVPQHQHQEHLRATVSAGVPALSRP